MTFKVHFECCQNFRCDAQQNRLATSTQIDSLVNKPLQTQNQGLADMRHIVDTLQEDVLPYHYDRLEQTVQIRRKNREKEFQRRRKMFVSPIQNTKVGERSQKQEFQRKEEEEGPGIGKKIPDLKLSLQEFDLLLDYVKGDKIVDAKKSISVLEDLVANLELSYMNKLLEKQIVPYLLQALFQNRKKQLRDQTISFLKAVFYYHDSDQFIAPDNKEIIFSLVDVLAEKVSNKSNNQCSMLQMLGNICFQNAKNRDIILETKIVEIVKQAINKNQLKIQQISDICWLLSNLCKGHPEPDSQQVQPVVDIICTLMGQKKVLNEGDISQCLWAICNHPFLVDYNSSIIKNDIVGIFINVCLKPNTSRKIRIPFTRLVGNISRGNKNCVKYLINKNVYNLIALNIQDESNVLRRQSYWLLSNLICDGFELAKQFLKHSLLVGIILQKFSDQSENELVQRQMAYVVRNMFINLYKQVPMEQYFVEKGVLDGFLLLLKSEDDDIVIEGLNILNEMLKYSEQLTAQRQKQEGKKQLNMIAQAMMNNGGVQILETLQDHKNENVYVLARTVLVSYYAVEGLQGQKDTQQGAV